MNKLIELKDWYIWYCQYHEKKKDHRYQIQVVILLGMGMTTWPFLPYFSSWSIAFHGRNLEPSNLDSSILISLWPELWPPTIMTPIPSGDVTIAELILVRSYGNSGPVNIRKKRWLFLCFFQKLSNLICMPEKGFFGIFTLYPYVFIWIQYFHFFVMRLTITLGWGGKGQLWSRPLTKLQVRSVRKKSLLIIFLLLIMSPGGYFFGSYRLALPIRNPPNVFFLLIWMLFY